ncbi:Imm21 family immunity protein [Hahella aquimaris]|uniref:Imm21 family immunity protein n=1 Tax=Hahella sp. HNIBRBA332 TaxID=3015983 RepID=UPI00273C4392|nr:Imm21 family immunity protein [Hahella sp. HNIBRBA332]WLQ17490.1 Imm21 family immunity protein [Hahella sp. HNIBRBA332]
MNWISSEGGPLILVVRKSLRYWAGLDGSDYERACAVCDYAGTIRVGNSEAVVLGDEPCQTAIYSSPHINNLVIVRWQWAESESQLERYLSDITNNTFSRPEEELRFNNTDEELLLFDSVLAGSQANGLRVKLSSGQANRTMWLQSSQAR